MDHVCCLLHFCVETRAMTQAASVHPLAHANHFKLLTPDFDEVLRFSRND